MPLSSREQEVFQFIGSFYQEHGKVPSARQIANYFGFKSSRAAQNYIVALKEKGVLQNREPSTSSYALMEENDLSKIQFLGAIAAGVPIEGFENREDFLEFDGFFGSSSDLFALRVMGDSMLGDNICHGDVAIIQRGCEDFNQQDILALRIGGDEFTLKRIRLMHDEMILMSSNPRYEPITVRASQVSIIGRFAGLLRNNR